VISAVFNIVAYSLVAAARLFGCTYNEINIIVYYMLVPLTWAVLADLALRKVRVTPVLLGFYILVAFLVRDFEAFADQVFYSSARFLLWFGRVGWDYATASVIICVIVPLVIYSVMIGWVARRLS
jgi:hypothetical protein